VRRGIVILFITVDNLIKNIFGRENLGQIKLAWQNAWADKRFRKNLIFGILVLAVLVVFTFYFFDYIENRAGGAVMNDWVLKFLPAKDVSAPIVFFEFSVIILFILRCVGNPVMIATFLIAYIFVVISRDVTIGITQLRAPIGFIELKDPLASVIYKAKSINRDLFYSGHASLLFLFYLCSFKKADRSYILFAVISISLLLLIQHVHYTIDVVCAPFFAYGCYWLSKKIPHYSLSKV
jgi:hypothetical protein